MDWRVVDERLIRRGELLLSLDFLESYDLDLSLLNLGKVGRPYRVTYMFLAVVRYLFNMPYRQLEGFTRALHRLIPRLFMGWEAYPKALHVFKWLWGACIYSC